MANSVATILNVTSLETIKRNVIVYSNARNKKYVFKDVNVNTLGEIQTLLAEMPNPLTFDINDTKIQEMNTKVIFEDASAVLPRNINTSLGVTNDVVIMIAPKIRMKSGASSKEIRAAIKDIILKNPKAKEHFNKQRNYTNKSTADLESLLKSYNKKSNSNLSELNKKAKESIKEVKPKVNKSEVLQEIKDIIAKNPDAKKHFGNRIHFTSTEVLQALLNKYKENNNIEETVEVVNPNLYAKLISKESYDKLISALTNIEKSISEIRSLGLYKTTIDLEYSDEELDNLIAQFKN